MNLPKPQRKGSSTELGTLRLTDSGKGSVLLGDVGAMLRAEPEMPDDEAMAAEGKPFSRPFRMLSADLIPGYWVDYSDPGIWTPEAVALFDKTTIYMDHDCPVSQWIGVATGARLTTSTGKLGVDADFTIDPVQDEMWAKGSIVRGMKLQPVPAVRSCSVGIHFEAKPSHMFQDFWEFWCRLGEEVEGSIVRWIVTKLTRIVEVSLVYAGADPGANALSLSAQARKFITTGQAPTEPPSGDQPMSALVLKAVKDVTGLEGDAAAPALYSLSEKAKDADKLQASLTEAQATIARYEAHIRTGLINLGYQKRNVNDAMAKDVMSPDGKTVLARSWANSISIDALREHVEKAPAMGLEPQPGPGPAANLSPPGQAPPANVGPIHKQAAHVSEIAAAFGKSPDKAMQTHADRQAGILNHGGSN